MRAVDLDRRVTIQTATETVDSHGDVVESWSDLGTYWAKKRPNRVSEDWGEQRELAKADLVFRVRWNSETETIAPKMRLVYDSENYDILGTQEIGREEGLDIFVERVS
jgi:SPP1 family predicted phage head-tail adaptor